jgi:ribonuclease R
LQSGWRSATLAIHDREFDLKRRKTTGSGDPQARNKRGPGKRSGAAKAPSPRALAGSAKGPAPSARQGTERDARKPARKAALPKFMPERLPPLPGRSGPKIQDPYADREASRYERPIASREAILALLEKQGELMTIETVARALHLSGPQDLDALTRRLGAMLRDGQLIQNRRGGYGVATKLDLIRGSVIANAEGFGFLRP